MMHWDTDLRVPKTTSKLPVPETAGAWPHRCSSPVVVSSNALCVEMLGQEVELVWCGLERQLMELLL